MTLDDATLALASRVALARSDFMVYCHLVEPTFQEPRHISLIGDYLMRAERGELKHLALIMHPRSGKSHTASGRFPAWFIGRDPKRKVILGTHTASLAESFSVMNRDVIDNNLFYRLVFPSVTISPTVRAAYKWAVPGEKETMIAGGIGTAVTGFGAHLLLIDDPVKDYEEAVSQTVQEAQWKWYQTTAGTRVFPGGVVIIIMTHWHENDLVGRVLNSEEGKDFTVVMLPAESLGTEAEATPAYLESLNPFARKYSFPDALGRPRGAPLWPEAGYDKAFLAKKRAVLGYLYEGLYQGAPSAPGGERFRRDALRPVLQQELDEWKMARRARIRSLDLAWSEEQAADNSAALRASLYQKAEESSQDAPAFAVVIEDMRVWKAEWETGGVGIVYDILIEDTFAVQVLIEAVASQNTAFKSLRRNPAFYKHHFKPVTPIVDKFARALYSIGLVNSGHVYVLYPNRSTAPEWERAFLDELSTFPNSTHDDQVDALTQMLNEWQPLIDSYAAPTVRQAGPRQLPHEFQEGQHTRPMRDKLAWIIGE